MLGDRTPVTKPINAVNAARSAPKSPAIRTSQALREILTKNPTVKNFTVQRIVESIGGAGSQTSLMLFSLPAIVPFAGASDFTGVPTGMIAGQMAAGRTQIKLPKFVLERSVPRRSLAVAIHAILPVLERAEKAARPRWRWVSEPAAQRVLAVFIFLLAIAVAIPMLGFNAPHAAAIFIISFGLAEQDGVAILVGVAAGVLSLCLMIGHSLSRRTFRSFATDWLKSLSKKLALRCAAAFFKKLGFKWAELLNIEWGKLLLLWDPEAPSRSAKIEKPGKAALTDKRKRQTAASRRKPARLPASRSFSQGALQALETSRAPRSMAR
ncbi:exopolysaccharide biosynthesis protein [Methylocella silvestris]|uniref:exopolysaccharide biosynthesis protein n=1 Tax=Methylocella silvestris TaxID=199596 RepID=UPI00244E5667|nr:exopolysaccharide biosynthesis protein [Methylocella silvestris]